MLHVNADQLKTERWENTLHLCGESWLTYLKIILLDGDDEGVFILPALDARSQILSIKDRRNGIGKSVFKLAPLDSGQTFSLVAPDLSIPGFSLEVFATGSFSSKQASCVMAAPPASPLFRRLAGRGVFFCGFLFRWVLHLVVYLIRGVL